MKKYLIILIIIMTFSIFSYARISSVEEQYIDLIKKTIEFGKYKDALELCDTIIKLNKESVDGYLWKGVAYELLDDMKMAEKMYNRAKELDPAVKIPDITKYRNLDEERKKNNEKIRSRYYELFGKKEMGLTQSAEPALPLAGEGVTLSAGVQVKSKEKVEEKGEDREYWVRGGKAKTLSLGGIEFVYPCAATAMDGFGNNINAGLLFRKTKHFFSAQPYYTFYGDTIKYLTGEEKKFDTMIASFNDSPGEISWANPFFLNRIVPFFSNSYKVDSYIPASGLPEKNKNTGTLLGGLYTIGLKPIPILGFTGSFGYKYIPYFESIEQSGTGYNSEVKATEIMWSGGAGLIIPYLISNQDELDFVAEVSSYSPNLDYLNLKNNLWFNMPDSLIYSYNFQRTIKSKGLTLYEGLPSVTTIENSELRETSGLNIKGNIHYMYGNGLHEFFVFCEAPFNISQKIQNKTEEKLVDFPITITSTSSDKVEVIRGRKFSLKTGLRNNLYYVTPGIKYEFDYSELYYNTTLTSKTGKELYKFHKITGGFNITPIQQITIPLELSYSLANMIDSIDNLYSAAWNIKGGLEIKPVPFFAIRGGMGYEFIRKTGNTLPSDGTENNPFLNTISYNCGAGFELLALELNAGYVFKEFYPTPEIPKITTAFNYQTIIYVDLNVYL